MLSMRGGNQKKLEELKIKAEEQNEKTETARANQSIYQEMFKNRHDINLYLTKRHNDMKDQLSHIKGTMSLIDTQLREVT